MLSGKEQISMSQQEGHRFIPQTTKTTDKVNIINKEQNEKRLASCSSENTLHQKTKEHKSRKSKIAKKKSSLHVPPLVFGKEDSKIFLKQSLNRKKVKKRNTNHKSMASNEYVEEQVNNNKQTEEEEQQQRRLSQLKNPLTESIESIDNFRS